MSVRVLEGHVLDVLASLGPGSVHCCVTSPPYWQLRAYGTPPQDWGDGWSGELGQEPSVSVYVAHLVEVFRAVRRVMRDDATLWVNLSGCYFSDPGGQNGGRASLATGLAGGKKKLWELQTMSDKAREANRQQGRVKRGAGGDGWLKPLDYVDVPGLFARAMQADGWLWRSDVTWVKPSPLPESIQGTRWERCRTKTGGARRGGEVARVEAVAGQPWIPQADHGDGGEIDGRAEWADCPGCPKCARTDGYVLRRGSGRPTRSTERVLLFAKVAGYFFDQEAVREGWADDRRGASGAKSLPYSEASGRRDTLGSEGRPVLGVPPQASGRNLRDWWVLSPEPLKDAHYAAYPTALPERCIKAGTSEWGCCPACGAPWARVIRPSEEYAKLLGSAYHDHSKDRWEYGRRQGGKGPAADLPPERYVTHGWRPTCRCPEHCPVPCRVLDPFGGSGTTGLAANRLGRDAVLVELKPQYADLARRRLGREPLSLFATHGDPVAAG